MTQSQRARRAKAIVALAAFVLGALLHVILTDAFRDSRSAYDALLQRPSLHVPSTVSSAGPTKQPSLARVVRTSSIGKDQLDVPPRSAVDWANAVAAISPVREHMFAAPAGIRLANPPRAPPSV